jgi:hypothetical protein
VNDTTNIPTITLSQKASQYRTPLSNKNLKYTCNEDVSSMTPGKRKRYQAAMRKRLQRTKDSKCIHRSKESKERLVFLNIILFISLFSSGKWQENVLVKIVQIVIEFCSSLRQIRVRNAGHKDNLLLCILPLAIKK